MNYCPFYCEENVWHACRELLGRDREAWVAFVSNQIGCVAMWQQHAAAPGRPVGWDYHAVLMLGEPDGWQVYDPDCRLGPWLALGSWLERSFPPLPPGAERFAPRFRVLPAALYLRELRSDRSHMRRGGRWLRPPPAWPPIGEGEGSNLMRFVDMQTPFLGEVVDVDGLRARFPASPEAPGPRERIS